MRVLILVVLFDVAIVAAVLACLLLLHRWQRGIWRRERGETPTAFPVIPSSEQQRQE